MLPRTAVLDTEKLREYMESKDINASELAAVIGVSSSCMSRLLNNKREPSGVVWSGLIGLLGKKVFNYIFFVENVSNDTKNKERRELD
ncbi:helix-turn-helix domain-containing protein [Paenibacillus polymyxa]|jgi:transcriptional regulator with XRE-family HTH domain|uniref:helix-turn-helix domain-containing protein n=1 Tax=Paenibacillus polymyxa TaxID=1406 RepID=UPI00083E6ABD|nr:helix-turn-helix transcriptional regulator [Paenibacillus polymyxa]ODB61383.1 hypothetical protein A7309_15160 [Paenibacillus polymyxa]